jgi:uncharacterized membrane protein
MNKIKMTFEKFLIVFCILSAIVVCFLIIRLSSTTDKCTERGGIMIQTPSGWMCGKIEKL